MLLPEVLMREGVHDHVASLDAGGLMSLCTSH